MLGCNWSLHLLGVMTMMLHHRVDSLQSSCTQEGLRFCMRICLNRASPWTCTHATFHAAHQLKICLPLPIKAMTCGASAPSSTQSFIKQPKWAASISLCNRTLPIKPNLARVCSKPTLCRKCRTAAVMATQEATLSQSLPSMISRRYLNPVEQSVAISHCRNQRLLSLGKAAHTAYGMFR